MQHDSLSLLTNWNGEECFYHVSALIDFQLVFLIQPILGGVLLACR